MNYHILRRSNLFRSLSDYEITKISQLVEIKNYKKGEYIIYENTKLDEVFILISGTVKMCRNNYCFKNNIKPYNYFGENALLNMNLLNHVSIIATGDVKCMSISRNMFNNKINTLKTLNIDYDYEKEKEQWEKFCNRRTRSNLRQINGHKLF